MPPDVRVMGETLLRRLHTAINDHDLEAFVACFAQDYDSSQPAHPDRAFRGRDQVRANWSAVFGGVPDFHAELVRVDAVDDAVWSEWRWSGTQADGGRLDIAGVMVLGARDDQIAWARLYMEPVEQGGAGIEAAVRGHHGGALSARRRLRPAPGREDPPPVSHAGRGRCLMAHPKNLEATMSSTRVPKAEITGVYGSIVKRMSRKMLGDVPEPAEVMWHNRKVLNFSFSARPQGPEVGPARPEPEVVRAHGGRRRWSAAVLPRPRLLPWPTTRDSTRPRRARCPAGASRTVFTPLERDVMEYAEAMTQTPPTVTDELSARLLEQLGAAALVELTAVGRVGEHVHARNTALGIESQGFSKACALPLRTARRVRCRRHDRRPVRHPPQPAVHRRLRDARLRRRRRGRGAGDLAAVGRRRPAPRCATRGPTWSGSSPGRR